MTKNRSKMLIIFLSIILIVGLVASFVSFTYPLSINGVTYKYSSFVDELVLGSDLSDGILLQYNAKTREDVQSDNYDELMDSTIIGLRNILNDSGFKNTTIAREGNDGIRLEVGSIQDKSDRDNLIALVGEPNQLVLSSSESATDETIFATSDDIKSVEAKEMSNGMQVVYYVEITFKKDSLDKIKEKTAEITGAGNSFYMLLGDVTVGSSSEAVTTSSISMSSDNFIDLKTTEQYAVQIRTGLLPLELTCTYYGDISEGLGYNAMVYIWVVLALMVVASFIFLAIRYKQIGGMAIFNLLFYIVLGLFFLQAVPLVHINLSGVFGIMVGYLLVFVALVNVLENARREYAKGKKLHVCLNQGINSSLTSTLSVNIMFTLAGIICALMPSMAIQSFGLVSLVLGLINMFVAQVWMRLLIKLYLPFNAYDGSKCNFTKEEGLKND